MLMYYTDPSVGGSLGLYIVFLIISLIIQISLCVWIYQDANERGQNGTLWLLVVVLAGCPGVIVYLIIRDN